MLLSMTIENFKSVKSSQTISFEAVKDNRLDPSKIIEVNDKINLIKTSAVIGPNGAGKSSFVRALEVLRRIVLSPREIENPLASSLSGTVFAYGIDKLTPANISIDVLLKKGTEGNEEDPTIIGRYLLSANREMVYEESLYYIVNGSKKLMFERKRIEGEDGYAYRFGKLYRGDKKRAAKHLPQSRTFLSESALAGGQTSSEMYSWFKNTLNILPMGVGTQAEQFVADALKKHPGWGDMLVNYLWALDITDIRRVGVREKEDGTRSVVFTHVYVNDKKVDGYSNSFLMESLSLRRLVAIGIAFFTSFVSEKVLLIDDFGQLLHPDVLCHLVEIFESCNKHSQMLVVDCNPSLLKDGLLRKDAIWFAQKDNESSTVFYSLSDFKVRSRTTNYNRYLQGAFGALPVTSDFYFVHDGTPVDDVEEENEQKEEN